MLIEWQKIWLKYIFWGRKKVKSYTLIKFSISHLRIIKMTEKKRALGYKEWGDEVVTASKFSGSDTEIEENVDITEVDEDYCTINDQIVQTCYFFLLQIRSIIRSSC